MHQARNLSLAGSANGPYKVQAHRYSEAPIRTCIVFLDHVQKLHIRAVRCRKLREGMGAIFFCRVAIFSALGIIEDSCLELDFEIRLDLRFLFTKEFDCIVTSNCRHCISTFSVPKYNYLKKSCKRHRNENGSIFM